MCLTWDIKVSMFHYWVSLASIWVYWLTDLGVNAQAPVYIWYWLCHVSSMFALATSWAILRRSHHIPWEVARRDFLWCLQIVEHAVVIWWNGKVLWVKTMSVWWYWIVHMGCIQWSLACVAMAPRWWSYLGQSCHLCWGTWVWLCCRMG
jgi:hypothetical protein